MMTAAVRRVAGGFDTHADVHVGAVFDSLTREPIATAPFPTTAAG